MQRKLWFVYHDFTAETFVTLIFVFFDSEEFSQRILVVNSIKFGNQIISITLFSISTNHHPDINTKVIYNWLDIKNVIVQI